MSAHARYVTMISAAKAGTKFDPTPPVVGDGDTTVYQRWSDPATWGGTKPVAGDDVDTTGMNVLLDETPPPLSSLTWMSGKFKVDSTKPNLALTVGSLTYMDGLTIGTSTQRYPRENKFTLTLTGLKPTTTGNRDASGNLTGGPLITGPEFSGGNNPTGNNGTTNDNQGISRGIRGMQGHKTSVYGFVPAIHQTKLAAHANAGDKVITLVDGVDWKDGDEVTIPPTGYFANIRHPEIVQVDGDTNGSNVVKLKTALTYFHFGLLQYPTDGGLSLTMPLVVFSSANDADLTKSFTLRSSSNPKGMKASPSTPTVIDHRACVELLTRNIVVQGGVDDNPSLRDGDSEWKTKKFGAHWMNMGDQSESVIDGVEFRRVGQAGLKGRYPYHWHMPSYNLATGASLGEFAPGKAVFRRNSIRNSVNRAVTLHAVRGAVVEFNTAVDILGHAYFMEDGSEVNNRLESNSAFYVRAPASADQLRDHDAKASGIWVSNFSNKLINNRTGDTARGIWHGIRPDYVYTTDLVFTGTGRAPFSRSSAEHTIFDGSVNFVDETVTLTCTDATAPAKFSISGTQGATGTATVGVQITAGGKNGTNKTNADITIGTPTTPFVVGDTIKFSVLALGGVSGPSRLAGSKGGANLHPWYMPPLVHLGNEAYTSQIGVVSGDYPVVESGASYGNTYRLTTSSDGSPIPVSTSGASSLQINTRFDQVKIHHCVQGYSNRMDKPQYQDWTQTDNILISWAGATNAGFCDSPLIACRTQNRDTNSGITYSSAENFAGQGYSEALTPSVAFAGYHGSLPFTNVTAYDWNADQAYMVSQANLTYLSRRSVMETWDTYLNMYELMGNNFNWCLWNSLPIFRTPARDKVQPYFADVTNVPNTIDVYLGNCIGIKDPTGQLSGTTDAANSYNLSDHPAIYYGADAVRNTNGSHSLYTLKRMLGIYHMWTDYGAPAMTGRGGVTYPAYAAGQGVACNSGGYGNNGATDPTGPYVSGGTSNLHAGSFKQNGGTTCIRYDPTTLAPAGVDSFAMPGRGVSFAFLNFSFFGMPSGGAVLVQVTNATLPSQRFACIGINNFGDTTARGDPTTDFFYVGFPWSSSVVPASVKAQILNGFYDAASASSFGDTPPTLAPSGSRQTFVQKLNKADFLAYSVTSGPGAWWQDTTNQIVWCKVFPLNTTNLTRPSGNSYDSYLMVSA